MNKFLKKTLLMSFAMLFLVACDPINNDPTDSTTDPTDTTSTSDTDSDIIRPTSGEEIIDLYAVNDFHGAILENGDEPGLAKMATYLKNKKQENPDYTVLLSSGDMWQGSFEAYHNKGEVITKAMNNIGFDSMTIGNHEFDWGTSHILDNAAQADFPLLGANIMKHPNWDEKSEVGLEYTILRRGALKIGVIGVIGQDQMKSICSRYIEDIYFAEHNAIIKPLARKLKRDYNADIVILSIHAGQEAVDYSIANGNYVDAVFNAHTHEVEQQVLNGVPFIQGGTKGQYVSHIRLKYDYAQNKITSTLKHENTSLKYTTIQADAEVAAIIDQYQQASDIAGSAYVGNARYYVNTGNLANISNYAAAQKAAEQNYDIDFAISNYARESIAAGQVYYRDLFRGLPFDNAYYIVRVRGSDVKNQDRQASNYIYRVKDYSSIDNNSYYTIAIIDFLILHQNIYKEYNYFSDYNPDTDFIGYLNDGTNQPIYPRDLVKEVFDEAPNKTINPYDYTGSRYNSITS